MAREYQYLLCLVVLLAKAAAHTHHPLPKSERASGLPSKIPKLLHYIYLAGYDSFRKGEQATPQRQEIFKSLRGYFDGCQNIHKQWDSVFWDEEMGRSLIQREYSWFLPIWDGYDTEDKKSDALRVFIMHHYGGLYLDFDIECFKPAEKSFGQFDLVLQGSGYEGFNNAVMASVPGHPLWMAYADVLKERGPGPVPQADRNLAKYMTGTIALTASLIQNIEGSRPDHGYLGAVFEYKSKSVKVWPLGEWFAPCFGPDYVCISLFEDEKLKSVWDTSNLYGRHYFLESSPKKHLEWELRDYYVQ